ncbi:hypothetical protein PS685_04188 [Pseudomonas fluorescens]|uniref:Uncharacterized protein n=1 Tax=Pseudomonas fluorescens TaxID=294 RepID=A0A5E6ZAH6_PSEFL|nr:hypothetical protein PS685_04188 [Pseudomonas fluorescens]
MLVGKNLDFHVSWLEYVLFHQHARIAKGRQGFALCRGQRLCQLGDVLDHLHALATTTCRGFEQHRIADAFCGEAKGFQILGFAVVTRHQRYARHFHQGLGGGLAAHGINGTGGRAEKYQPGSFNGTGKACVLRQKAITGMNGLGPTGLGGCNDLVDFQVAVGRFAAPQVYADIGFAAMPRIAIGRAVDGYCGEAQGPGCAHYPAGDFATVGNQYGCQNRGAHERGSRVDGSACQLGARFCRKARKPSWPSGLTRMRAMAFSQ